MSEPMVTELLGVIPVFWFSFDNAGKLLRISDTCRNVIGYKDDGNFPRRISDILPEAEAAQLTAMATRAGEDIIDHQIDLRLVKESGSIMEVRATIARLPVGQKHICLCMAAVNVTEFRQQLSDLRRSHDMLLGFIETSTEAMWCIEFADPVDLSCADTEIIRQVFENECYWTMCNKAMARMYNLPENMDFNAQQVSMFFPRNPENEVFVQQLIDCGFHIDNAPSTDIRHDGSTVYCENSVRGRIESGKLLRMWGTVRDVTANKKFQQGLIRKEEAIRDILSAVPDGVFVMDEDCVLCAANPAFGHLLELNIDEQLGRDLRPFIDLTSHLPRIRRREPLESVHIVTEGYNARRQPLMFEVSLSKMPYEVGPERYVAVVRRARLEQ